MDEIDPTVVKETRYVSIVVLILSVFMQGIFLIAGKWDITVLWGNLLSAATGILNFLLLGITVTKALTKDEKDMASYMKLSKTYRFLLVLAILGVGIYFKCFNDIAVIVPVFFPTIAIYAKEFLRKNKKNGSAEGSKTDAV